MKSCRVASADFHAIDCRECLVHGEDGVDTRIVDTASTQVAHHNSCPQPVSFDRPCGVARRDKERVDRFEVECVDGRLRIEVGFECIEVGVERTQLGTEHIAQSGVTNQKPNAWSSAQKLVGCSETLSNVCQRPVGLFEGNAV